MCVPHVQDTAPGLQGDVAVEDPAVLKLHRLWRGGPITRGDGGGVGGVPAGAPSASVQ